nr:MAG TPA: hypothetical protein [Caudoviricetes sp.]
MRAVGFKDGRGLLFAVKTRTDPFNPRLTSMFFNQVSFCYNFFL